MQAQEHALADWSIGQRAPIDTTAVADALARGSILRTHMLRPTWHFVLPADIRWMQALTAPRVHAFNAYYYRQLGLDDELFDRSARVLTAALAGGNHLTRPELATELAAAGIPAADMRLAYIVMHAELEAVVCSGPRRGRQHTYALVSERAPQTRELPHDEALAELTTRYFASHGPATAKDFAWWSSLTMAEVRRGIGLAGPALVRDEADGRTYWSGASDPPPPAGDGHRVHLLQGFDEYVVAYSETKDVSDRSGIARAAYGDGVPFYHPIVLDGQVVGTWRRTLAKATVTVETLLFTPLDEPQRAALQAAADRFGRFIGRSAALA